MFIFQRLRGECPWPSAQAEIGIINAYKSPRDKMACIVRCCETIENLIILASERGAASADDITPVLVYVLIQVRFFLHAFAACRQSKIKNQIEIIACCRLIPLTKRIRWKPAC